MALRLRPLAILNRLRSTYWFVPAVVTVAAVVLAVLLVAVDRMYPNSTAWLGWAYGGGADGARALLSAVAGSIMTVVSVTFSVMVVALTVSSQHFGPRLLNSFMRDNAAQLVLGTFTGTFAYCLMVLRTVQGEGDGYSTFVPHLAVTAALILTLISVGMLIFYVHHIATALQVSEITAGVARDLERTVGALYPEPFGGSTEPPRHQPPPVPDGAFTVQAGSSGYLREIDSEAVLALACERTTIIWLLARPGDFIIEDRPLAAVDPPPRDADDFARRLRRAYVIGTDRTSTQDADFAVQQLVEVALRALSPGVNEPFTAITCIDRLGQGLTKLASRRIPGAVRTDDTGAVRVIAQPRTFVELVEAAFDPIARYAGRNPAIARRLLETLGVLADVAHRSEDREAMARLADFVWTSSVEEVEGERHTSTLARLHTDVHRRLRRSQSAGSLPT
jgi:uncharacterized membrane protein